MIFDMSKFLMIIAPIDRSATNDAYVRCSSRSFARASAAWSQGGHEFRPDGGGESLLGRL
jgi:hypothetical protein